MINISIKLTEEQANHLKKLSHQLSLERNKDLSLSDIVREALDKTFPITEKKEKTNE